MGPVEYVAVRSFDGLRRAAAAANRRAERVGEGILMGLLASARLVRLLPAPTVPWAIAAAGLLIALALLLGPLVAPYRLIDSGGNGFWRLNAVTGDVRGCAGNQFALVCGEETRPNDRTVDKIQ